MLDVASDSNTNFSNEDDAQEHWESQNHPARLAQRSTTADKRDDEDHWTDNHQNYRSRPERFADEVFVVVIRVLNDGANDDCKQSRQLKVKTKFLLLEVLDNQFRMKRAGNWQI